MAGVADLADGLSFRHDLPAFDADSAEVGVAGGIAVAVGDNDVQAVSAGGVFDGDGAGIGRYDRTTVDAGGRDVNAAVQTAPAIAIG